MSFQTPITISDAIEKIDSNQFLLPAIQREFIWNHSKIEWLFDSIMRNYPISSFLFWKVEETTSKGYRFYKFINEYRERYKTHNEEISTNGISSFNAVLDGQQRLTSLYLGLKGSFGYKEYRRKWEDTEWSIPTRHLYLNITTELQDEEDGRIYEFSFLEKSETEESEIYEANEQKWFKVGAILNYTEDEAFDEFVEEFESSFSRKAIRQLRRTIMEKPIINYFLEKDQSLDKALNIFIRINSGGEPLNFSDLLMSIAVLSWLYIMYLGEGISGASIPTDSFLFFTKLYNSHWYPMYSGALNTIEYVHLLPTISIFMLYVMTSLTSQGAKYIVREAHIIILVLAILSSIGVLASFFDNTFIIKLSLHRASSFMVAIALIPIIIKLWNDIFNAKILYRSIAIYLLLSPFLDFKLPGFSLFFTLIYATHLLIQIKEEGSKKKIFTALTIWLIGVFALFYSAAPLYFNKIIQPSYDGIKLTLILIIFMLISKYQPLNFIKNNKYLFQLISLILISIFIIKENMERTEGYRSERSSAYNETQVWAKINTRKDALFMIDPNFDGWRDVSQRASFGTANEWLHKAWLYDSDLTDEERMVWKIKDKCHVCRIPPRFHRDDCPWSHNQLMFAELELVDKTHLQIDLAIGNILKDFKKNV